MLSFLWLFLYPILTLTTCYLLHSLVTFTIHLRQARASGLPYMVMPYSENNIINVLCLSSETLPRLARRYLPAWLADRVQFNTISCRWTVRDRMFKKLGRVFLIVSPGGLNCHIADAEVASHIYRTRQQFVKQTRVYREYTSSYIRGVPPAQSLFICTPETFRLRRSGFTKVVY